MTTAPAQWSDLIERLIDEEDLCRAETATDIADLLGEAIDALAAAQAEIERLRELNDGSFYHVWVAAEAKVRALEEALREILNPLGTMAERAKADGRQLSGMAYSIANSVPHLQSIARAALFPDTGGERE